MIRKVLAALILAPALAAACGGGSSFPEPGPCPIPASPTAVTPGRSAGGSAAAAYSNTIRIGIARLSDLREGQRSRNPDDTFPRKPEFRTNFATYADNTVCAAQALQALNPPDQRYTEFDTNLAAALQVLIDQTTAGRAAVGQRNVSDYRKWFRDVDGKIEAVHVLYDGRPR